MPVLPLVESSRVFPGANWPLRRPSATMLAAARSLTERPGLYHSALPRMVTPGSSRVRASRRSRGVLPMRSTRLRPKVSPSPEADSTAPFPFAEVAIASILAEPGTIAELKNELNSRDHRNVLYKRKHDM